MQKPLTITAAALLLLLLLLAVPAAFAQERIYRCGNEYTNDAAQARERGCKLVEGGNITVLQSARPASAPTGLGAAVGNALPGNTLPFSMPRVSNNDQKARDQEARSILESELRKAEARHADLLKEYNDGSPERGALELRNPQRHVERTAEIKASLARSESDIAGIRREISRLPAAAAAN